MKLLTPNFGERCSRYSACWQRIECRSRTCLRYAQASMAVCARSKAHVCVCVCVLQERTILIESGYTNALVLNAIQLCATQVRGRQVGARKRDGSAFRGCSAGGRTRDRRVDTVAVGRDRGA